MSENGSEDASAHIFELDNSRELPDVVPRVNFAIRETVALTTLSICSRAKTPRAARFCGYHWFSLTIAQTAHEGDRASIEDFVPTWNTPPKISRGSI